MKKWIFILTGLIAVLLLFTYLFIPNIITLKTEKGIAVTQQGLHRMLLDSSNVEKWWPGDNAISKGFTYNEHSYKIINNNISLLAVIISNKQNNISSSLYIISVNTDSVQLVWVGAMASSYNPIKRISAWLKAKNLNNDMNTIMEKIKTFYGNYENIFFHTW